jgi:Ca2+-transporting ATPase
MIVEGQCRAVVCAVGKNSTRDYTNNTLDTDVDTELQKKLKNLSGHFTLYALYGAAAIFILLVIMMFIDISTQDADPKKPSATGKLIHKIVQNANLAVIIMVVSIPEGLTLTIGISLAFSVKKMYAQKILVKKLDAPEKMAGITDMCVGKTGTLTKGNMEVKTFYCEQR